MVSVPLHLLLLAAACGGAAGPRASVLLGRSGAVMAYDPVRHVTLLFGGRGPTSGGDPATDQGGLWAYDGARWSLLAAGGPAARNSAAAAFDEARGRFVLFGGRAGTAPTSPAFADTWEWNGKTWTRAEASQSGQAAREHAGGAWDPARRVVTIAGGFDGVAVTDLHDQWEWSGSTWTQTAAAVPNLGYAPVLVNDGTTLWLLQSQTSDRLVRVLASTGAGTWAEVTNAGNTAPHLTAYAASRDPAGGIVLFGGSDGANTLAETWRWDGGAWAKLSPAASPPARTGAMMAFDADRGVAVLYGGETVMGPFADTWEFDGATWTPVSIVTGP